MEQTVEWSRTAWGGRQYNMDFGLEADLWGPCVEQGLCEI